MFTNFDKDLIAERNARLLHEVRAERFRRRSRKDRDQRSGVYRIAEFVQRRLVIGQETTAEKV